MVPRRWRHCHFELQQKSHFFFFISKSTLGFYSKKKILIQKIQLLKKKFEIFLFKSLILFSRFFFLLKKKIQFPIR